MPLNSYNTNKFIDFNYDDIKRPIYIPSQQKLLAFCFLNAPWISNCKLEIISLDLMNEAAEWQHYDDIQFNGWIHTFDDAYDAILGFANIILIFDFYNLDIMCYHLLDNTSYKSKCKIPETMKYNPRGRSSGINSFAIKNGDNNVHIINFGSGKHVQADLFKLIPTELLQSHRRHYQSLIMGYLREIENENNIPCIAFVLKTLIVKFFPL